MKHLARELRKNFDAIRRNITECYVDACILPHLYPKGITLAETATVQPTDLMVADYGNYIDPTRYEVGIIVHVKPIK